MDGEWNEMENDFQDKAFNDPERDGGTMRIRQDRLYIVRIPQSLTPRALEKLFNKFGKVTSFFVSPNREKSFVLVTYETVEEARAAMAELNETPPLHLSIKFARDNSTNDKSSKNQRNTYSRDGPPHRSNNNYNRDQQAVYVPARDPQEPAPPVSKAPSIVSNDSKNRSMPNNDYNDSVEEPELLYEEEDEAIGAVNIDLKLKRLRMYKAKLDYEEALLSNKQLSSMDRYITADSKIVFHNPLAAFPSRAASRNTVREPPTETSIIDQSKGEWGNVVVKRQHSQSENLQKKESSVDAIIETLPPLVGLTKPVCVLCRCAGTGLCGRCKVCVYCGHTCQRLDWPRHRKVCANLAPPPNGAAADVNVKPEVGDHNIPSITRPAQRPISEINGRPPLGYKPPVFASSDTPSPSSNTPRNYDRGPDKTNRGPPRSADRAARPGRPAPHQNGQQKHDGHSRQYPRSDGNRKNSEPAQGAVKSRPSEAVKQEFIAKKESMAKQEPIMKQDPIMNKEPVVKQNPVAEQAPIAKQVPATPISTDEVPEHYMAELSSVGAVMSVTVETPGQPALGVAVGEAQAVEYSALVEMTCDTDTVQFSPSPGDLFCMFNDDGWYRALCLDSESAALIDAGRVVKFSEAKLRRIPDHFVNTAQVSCEIHTNASMKVGDTFILTANSISDGVVEGVLKSENDTTVGDAKLTRWRPKILRPELKKSQSGTESAAAPETKASTTPLSQRMMMLTKKASQPEVKRESASAERDLPEKYAGDSLTAASTVNVGVEAVLDGGSYACVPLNADLMSQYEQLLVPLTVLCDADPTPFSPTRTSLFCLQDDTKSWYRARLVSESRAALIDAGRIVPLQGCQLRKIPKQFETLPQFSCLLHTDTPLKVEETFTCTLRSTTDKVHSVTLVRITEGGPSPIEATLSRWRPYADFSSAPAIAAASPAVVPENIYGTPIEPLRRPDVTGGSTVVIVEATSLDRVFVRPADDASTNEFDQLISAVAAYGLDGLGKPLSILPVVGSVVLSEFEGVFYRANVMKTKHKLNKYMIEYLEYGNEEVLVGTERMRACPAELAPAQRRVMVSQVKLHGAGSTLSESARAYLNSLKDDSKLLTLSLPDDAASAPSGSAVMLTEVSSRVRVNQRLEELSKPEWKRLEEQGKSILDLPLLTTTDVEYCKLPAEGAELRVLSADYLQEGFVFACRADEPAYVKEDSELSEYCSSKIGSDPYLPRPNELCIARMTFRGATSWRRALSVEQLDGPGGAKVLLVCIDDGLEQAVPHTDIRKMLKEFLRRPATGLVVHINGFPKEAPESTIARAKQILEKVPLVARSCRLIEPGEYAVEAPGLIAAIADVD